ncbi:MAG: hypothetical protein ACI35R_03765 [Bacillus sp. (in: firmicutes)]
MKVKRMGLILGILLGSLYFTEKKTMAYEKKIHFSGYEWEVRNNEYLEGPGPNYFSDSDSSVWVDSEGQLHLKLRYQDGKWYGVEVINTKALGYGKYTFYVDHKVDALDPNVILGLFTYDTDSPDASLKAHREIDIEFAEWGNSSYPNSQYTIWGRDAYREFRRFNELDLSSADGTWKEFHVFDISMPPGTWSTHSFHWKPQKLHFESLGGHYPEAPSEDFVWQRWDFISEKVPDEGLAKVHMNLWLFEGDAPTDGAEVEVVISSFTFTPYTEPDELKESLSVNARLDGFLKTIGLY